MTFWKTGSDHGKVRTKSAHYGAEEASHDDVEVLVDEEPMCGIDAEDRLPKNNVTASV